MKPNTDLVLYLLIVLAILITAVLYTSITLALFPLILVFLGIIIFRQSGATMAVLGWITALALAVIYFHTGIDVALAASLYGIIKSLGITVAVLFTMYLIFLMKEANALEVIAGAIRRVAATKEEQAIFIGVGFGAFVTSLGVVTPSLFPPLLIAMGFDPFSAVSIAVLGYNATTSFALLSIPVTLPASLFAIDPVLLSYKICLYLPVLSTLISFAMLYMIGGFASVRRGWFSALISGLCIGISALVFVLAGAPVLLIGVLAGAFTMFVLYILSASKQTSKEKLDMRKFLWAISPWLVLIAFALVISVPQITQALKQVDGPAFYIFDKPVDFDILIQIYTWIFLACLISIPLLKLNGGQVKKVTKLWAGRILQPFLAYSLFFAIAYIMAWSAMKVVNGNLVPSDAYHEFNMNLVVANALAGVFGASFVYVAAWLGLFGAVVGGSEASSNVMFYPIQKNIAQKIGLSDSQFLTTYAAHANGGGIASAITPSKINNAVVTINGDATLESRVMRKHLVAVMLITIITGIMNALFVAWNL
ncbi:MAG: L-lactate permease [Thermoplasmata archaeon]|nr:L-lactate permease [Thermoplasmata archaeon]